MDFTEGWRYITYNSLSISKMIHPYHIARGLLSFLNIVAQVSKSKWRTGHCGDCREALF
jgi:hypothetical protein